MRVHTAKGKRTITLTKQEEQLLANCAALLGDLARYPEDYPRAAAAADVLGKLKEPLPEAKK